MSKCAEIREICGDYALDVEYSKEFTFTMFFNSRRNAETVKRVIEVDDSVPNVATVVDFVEVVRCKDCKHYKFLRNDPFFGVVGVCRCVCPEEGDRDVKPDDFCSHGERK